MALNPMLGGIGAFLGGESQVRDTEGPNLRSQANDLRQKQIDQMSGPSQGPQMPRSGFGLPDILALLGAAASGRHADVFLGSYLQSKQQGEAQAQQMALQQWGEQQQQRMNLANVYGQQAQQLDRNADQTSQDAIDKTRNTNAFLGNRLDAENKAAIAKENAQNKLDLEGLKGNNRLTLAQIKEQGGLAKINARAYGDMAKRSPQARVQWALANKYSPEEARALGEATPQELLATARVGKIADEVKALQSRVKVDDARANQIVTATRYIGKNYEIKAQQLANAVRNVDSLVQARQAGIQLRRDQLEMGRSTLNAALVSSSKMRNTAEAELTKLQKLGSNDPKVLERMQNLQDSIESSTNLYGSLMEQAKLVPEIDPQAKQMAQDFMQGNPVQVAPMNPLAGPIGALPSVPNPVTGPVRNTTPPAPARQSKSRPATNPQPKSKMRFQVDSDGIFRKVG